MKYVFYIVILFVTISPSCKKAEIIEEKYGDLMGKIVDEFGQPLAGANVEVNSRKVFADDFGSYMFEGLVAKQYEVMASRPNYLTELSTIQVQEDQVAILDFILYKGDPFLELSDSIFIVPSLSGEHIIDIASNSLWTIVNNSSWISVDIVVGVGDSSFVLSYPENQNIETRIDSVIIKSGTVSKILIVEQSSKIQLISQKAIIGNNEIDMDPSIHFLFNRPIFIEHVISNWEWCNNFLDLELTDDNHGIKFIYRCGRLLGKYPFQVLVNDSYGNIYDQVLDVEFYHKGLDITGIITDFIFLNDEKEILISTIAPSKLLRYDIETNSILNSYDLSAFIGPLNLSFNPYNSKVYIMGSNAGITGINFEFKINYFEKNEVYTFNTLTDEISFAFEVYPDEIDHPDYPEIVPIDIGFTMSGVGIIALKSINSSGLRWKIIDASKNDSIYLYTHYDNEVDEYIDFNAIHSNFDQSKLILVQRYGINKYGVFDLDTERIKLIYHGQLNGPYQITTNKLSPDIFFREKFQQYIANLNEVKGVYTYIDIVRNGKADFSYREDEQSYVYMCEEDNFYLVDYNTGTTLMSRETVGGILDFTSTVDGKLNIAFKHFPNNQSRIYQFASEEFSRYLE